MPQTVWSWNTSASEEEMFARSRSGLEPVGDYRLTGRKVSTWERWSLFLCCATDPSPKAGQDSLEPELHRLTEVSPADKQMAFSRQGVDGFFTGCRLRSSVPMSETEPHLSGVSEASQTWTCLPITWGTLKMSVPIRRSGLEFDIGSF